jgi:hypothetical protein
MLAARARGLASAWTQIHIQFEEGVAAVLGINHAEVQQAALIPVAYPRREDFKPAYREPIQKFTHWDSWSPCTTAITRPGWRREPRSRRTAGSGARCAR